MREINLLDSYPRARRNIAARAAAAPEQRAVARQFGREYFDGERTQGYGGYRYDGRWVAVARRMQEVYGLVAGQRVLDVGCAKGFLVYDLRLVVPGIEAVGLDVSAYALEHCLEDVRPCLVQGTADRLPFRDHSFDLVVSVNTIHNLPLERCREALREMERVSRAFKYVQVDSWLNDQQRQDFERWQLTALTYFDPAGWCRLFWEAGYDGDYYWTITE